MAQTLVDKIWSAHEIRPLGDGWSLLHIDRHLLHDLSGPPALAKVFERGLDVRQPDLTFSTPDHAISSRPGRTGHTWPTGARLYDALQGLSKRAGIRNFDVGSGHQGIVHVVAPELGIALPGSTLICGDSHTCTNGGLGAIAFGVGTSESAHALATQTLRMRRPKDIRIRIDGELGPGVTAKDLALHLIRTLGTSVAVGCSVEFCGTAISALDVEQRLTLCNLSVEMGARFGLVAPDEKTVEYMRGRRYAPKGQMFEQAAEYWLSLATDEDAAFERDLSCDAADIPPVITWGTSPEQAIAVTQTVPRPEEFPDEAGRSACRSALDYMGLEPGQSLEGTSVDWAFIGSCTNSRISDLREAAAIVRGRKVAGHVTAWVVPGSEPVKQMAEAEGLDEVFRQAGFEWREPGCAMCVAANGEQVPPRARSISTTNRNFVGRQGPNARTHLASPAMTAAAAVAGHIVDVRRA